MHLLHTSFNTSFTYSDVSAICITIPWGQGIDNDLLFSP
jgi:hypothetical protein